MTNETELKKKQEAEATQDPVARSMSRPDACAKPGVMGKAKGIPVRWVKSGKQGKRKKRRDYRDVQFY